MESAGADTALRLPPCDDGGKPESQSATLRPGHRPERNSIVPPYWKRYSQSSLNGNGNGNGNPNASAENLAPPPIQLEDHTDAGSEQCKALWAKSVTVDDYVIVSGTAPGVGSYVVWNCTVETLDVSCLFPGAEVSAVFKLHQTDDCRVGP
jgi:hypothetical protein